MYPVLETERLILRPFREGDAESVFELICAYKQQNEGNNFTDINTLDDAKRINNETIKNDDEFIIIDNKSLHPIGWVLCHKALGRIIHKRTFIHMWIRSEYRHIGLGREILEKVMNFCFYGIQSENVVTNVKNSENKAYQLMLELGFEIYNHFPKTKFIDDNTIMQFKISKEKYTKQKYAFIDTYEYELPKKAASPYSYSNPVRKIESIKYIKQPTGYLCGQSVIAMLADVSVDEVITVMKNEKGTSTSELRDALKWYGIKTTTKSRIKYAEGTQLPDCCILSVKLPDYGHWSLYYKGTYYDPEFGLSDKLPEKAKLISYLGIVTNSNPAV